MYSETECIVCFNKRKAKECKPSTPLQPAQKSDLKPVGGSQPESKQGWTGKKYPECGGRGEVDDPTVPKRVGTGGDEYGELSSEFKVGDLVKCGPFAKRAWQTQSCLAQLSKSGRIIRFQDVCGYRCALIAGLTHYWPVEAILLLMFRP